jgi:1-acyl-sn-glycerol-3-phosphate acyltransferase
MMNWLMKLVLLGPLMRLWCRPRVEGAEQIPTSGGVVLARNHLAVADSFYLMLMVRRQIFFRAKREYFTQPGVLGWMKR